MPFLQWSVSSRKASVRRGHAWVRRRRRTPKTRPRHPRVLLDKGTRRVTIHLPYDKGGWLDSLYREAKVESVEYGETIDIVAVCTPRVLGRVKDYVEGYTEPKEDWE